MRSGTLACLLVVVAACIFPSSGLAHITGEDHATGLTRWAKGASLGPDWVYALSNAAVVWDHVWYQSHNFAQDQSNYEILHRGSYIDGEQGTVLAQTNIPYHNRVDYDTGDRWHLNVNVQSPSSSIDLWGVAAHENGHTLHLFEFFSCCPTMYQVITYANDNAWRSLESYDETHIRGIYPCASCRGFS